MRKNKSHCSRLILTPKPDTRRMEYLTQISVPARTITHEFYGTLRSFAAPGNEIYGAGASVCPGFDLDYTSVYLNQANALAWMIPTGGKDSLRAVSTCT